MRKCIAVILLASFCVGCATTKQKRKSFCTDRRSLTRGVDCLN